MFFPRFDQGQSQQPIFLDDLACNGSESLLISCPNPGIGVHNCAHFEDVALECTFDASTPTFPTSPPTLSTSSPSVPSKSIVEVKFAFLLRRILFPLC